METANKKNRDKKMTKKSSPHYLDAKCRCHAMHINITSS
jgi:hypothetical protein